MNRRMIKRLAALTPIALVFGLSSCFQDEDTGEYGEWKVKNEKYIEAVKDSMKDGKLFFTKLMPDWAPNGYSLIHWHNDTLLTRNNLKPMDNSTVQITYEVFDIEGTRLSDSFSNTDSIYSSKPSSNIIGVWYSLTQMHIGDSVTIVMPYQSGYGAVKYGNIKPYTTLIYNIKMKGISAYEIK